MNLIGQILLSSIIPALLSLAGIIYVQRSSLTAATSESGREQRRWAREHRKEAHVALLQECESLFRWAAMHFNVGYEGENKEYREPGPDWMKDAFDRLTTVEIFAGEEAGRAASRLVEATEELDGTPGAAMRFANAAEKFRKHVQRDLNLQVTDLGKETYDA